MKSYKLVAAVVAAVVVAAVAGAAITLTFSHRSSSDSSRGSQLVWCAAPGEKVDAQFKREYPDLHIAKVACDAFKHSGG